MISLLSQSLEQGKLFSLVNELVPQHPGYARLAKELDRYQAIADSGLWYPLDNLPQLSLNQSHSEIPRLRWMLKVYGDLPDSKLAWLMNEQPQQDPLLLAQAYRPGDANPVYKLDADLVDAIKHFQSRSGLTSNGELDGETLNKLNIPPYFMAQRIALNMKRWRYLPKHMGEKYILVNMANYHLDLIEAGKSKLNMKVIIGRQQRRTPVLAETISSVVLAPEWNVPHRIAIRDILPVAQRNPSYLSQHNFKVYEGWQEPAQEVSLARLGFVHGRWWC